MDHPKHPKHPKNVVTASDRAILRERYEFVPSSRQADEPSWEDRMVQKYDSQLYKEFALADLSMPGRLGLRWRTKQEVLDGRGEISCGNKRCFGKTSLTTLEVPFRYQEKGVEKKTLVKLRLCPKCLPLIQKPNSTGKKHAKPSQRQASTTSSTRRNDKDKPSENRTPAKKDASFYRSLSSKQQHNG